MSGYPAEDPGSKRADMLEIALNLFNYKGALIGLLVLLPLERLLPMHQDQKILRRAWKNDLVYLIVNGIYVGAGLSAFFVGIDYLTEKFVPQSLRVAVAAQPSLLQFVEILIVSDLGFYAVHRMFHAIPWLWNFHQIHHSIEELDWLAGFRVHPIDQILTKGISLAPVLMLGFSAAPILAAAWLYLCQSMFIHANVRTGGFGPARWLLASPEFHHWHHADDPRAYNANFAGQLPILDLLFDTMYMPRKIPDGYGIEQAIPDTYISQLFYPIDDNYPVVLKTRADTH
jgi:sterol desaturase/sphingolipid hydroxylase (fatty acid hydroxylase superfamily)